MLFLKFIFVLEKDYYETKQRVKFWRIYVGPIKKLIAKYRGNDIYAFKDNFIDGKYFIVLFYYYRLCY